ncbi:N-acetyltransferase family protein [Sutcliffiella cohnii]
MSQLTMKFTAKDGSEVVLRPITLQDAEDIVTAVTSIIEAGEYIQKDVPRTVEEERQFIQSMIDNENMYMGVEREGKVIGIARIIKGDIKMKRHTGLFRTWIIEEGQGLGIGKKIMEYTNAWCRQYKLRKLCLTVFSTNKPAYKLYERYGFVEEGVQKEQAYINGQYVDEILMAQFYSDK